MIFTKFQFMKHIFNFSLSILLLTLSFFSAPLLFASDLDDLLISSRTSVYSVPWFGEFDENSGVNSEEFVKMYIEKYLDHDYKFELIKTQKDKYGWVHERYQEFYKGVKVNHGLLNLHLKNNELQSFNGEIYTVDQEPIDIDYHEVKSRMIAKFIQAADVDFLDEHKFQLPVYSQVDDSHDLAYCYQFRVASADQMRDDYLFYSPSLNEIVRIEEQLIHSDSVGTAKTFYRGTKSITTDYISRGNFKLQENTRPIRTYDGSLGNHLRDTDNNWNTAGKEIAGDVHWGMELLHDYMDSTFGWDSYANNNDSMTAILNFGGSGNAFWNLAGNYATFLVNKTASVNPCAALDVVGHEFGHGIADENAGLVYRGEPCMLHESFADITGHILEFHEDSVKASNWLLGDEVWNGGIRNLRNPAAFRHPMTYKGTNWGRGCHSNGGVQNYWFYMMIEGDTGTNDLSHNYSVKGLGRDKAIQIMYRAMFYYVTPNTTFPEMAAHTLRACKDIFGACGPELKMTWDAWKAVGIEDTTVQLINLEHGIAANKLRCTSLPVSQTFKSKGDPNRKVMWDFGNGDTTSKFDVTKQYSTYGSRTIYLTTEVCNKTFKDTFNIRINGQPVASYTANQDVFCLGSNTDLIGTNKTVNPDPSQTLLYKWRLDPYQIEYTTKDLTFPIKDKQYNFTAELTAYYATGCTSSTKKDFSLMPSPEANFEVKSTCSGIKVPLVNKSDTSRPVIFKWKLTGSGLPGGTIETTGYQPSFTFDIAQDIDITLEIVDTETNCTDFMFSSFSVYANPVPSFTYENNCMNDTLKFVHTTQHSQPLSWFQWDLGLYRPFNKTPVTYILRSPEPFVMSLEVRDNLGCKGKVYDTIPVHEISADFDNSPMCLNDQKRIISNAVGDNLSYYWDLGNGNFDTDTNATPVYNTAGVYQVALTTNNDDCSVTKIKEIEVLDYPSASFKVEGYCQGDSTHFMDQSDLKDLDVDYTWSLGDGNSSTDPNPSHFYEETQTTTYFVKLDLTTSEGCSNQFTDAITVNEKPHCDFKWDYNFHTLEVQFIPDSLNYSTYAWDFGDGNSSSDASPIHKFANENRYTVTVNMTDNQGCECSSTENLRGNNVGIDKLNSEYFSIFPNPNNGQFYLKVTDLDLSTFRVMNSIGKVVLEGETSTHVAIDLKGKTAGLYFIELIGNNKKLVEPFVIH